MGVRPGEAPKSLRAEVNFKGTAERLKFRLTFVNMTGSEFRALTNSGATLGEVLLALISEWDSEYPLSVDGFVALEDERPGVCDGLLKAWWKARALEIEGN